MLIGLCACTDNRQDKYPTVIRTGVWEVCKVNDSTLMAVPTNSNGGEHKPILFKLSDVENFDNLSNE